MFKFFKSKKSRSAEIVDNPTSHSRIDKRERKRERLMRRKLRWGIIRRYKLINELQNSKSLYDVKNVAEQWKTVKDIINDVKDIAPNDLDIKVVNRFLRIERLLGRCQEGGEVFISLEDYYSKENLDFSKYLMSAYDDYEEYWDDVLENYNRPSAKRNRLQYLIESLDKDSEDPMTDFPDVRAKLSNLRRKYNTILEELTSS